MANKYYDELYPQYAFDERQRLERYKAYKYAFFTAVLYFLINAVLYQLNIVWIDSVSYNALAGFYVSMLVFKCMSIFKDAYNNTPQKLKTHKIFVVMCIVVDVVFGAIFIRDYVKNNTLENNFIYIVMLISFSIEEYFYYFRLKKIYKYNMQSDMEDENE